MHKEEEQQRRHELCLTNKHKTEREVLEINSVPVETKTQQKLSRPLQPPPPERPSAVPSVRLLYPSDGLTAGRWRNGTYPFHTSV